MAVFFQSFARHFSLYNLTAAVGLCAALVFALRRLSADGFDRAACRRIAPRMEGRNVPIALK